jgi:twitching motility protein PilT
MQTFDQSLMALLKSGVITYEEALRQATNPDDFALRVSGVSATSDTKWDNFEKTGVSIPPGPRPAQPAAAPPAPSAPRPAPAPGQPIARMTARPQAKASQPEPGGPDDDFQIERF